MRTKCSCDEHFKCPRNDRNWGDVLEPAIARESQGGAILALRIDFKNVLAVRIKSLDTKCSIGYYEYGGSCILDTFSK